MLLDSNIIVYAALPEREDLRQLIAEQEPAVSAINYVEVLGYHRLSPDDRRFFEVFFASARVLELSQPVLDRAVELRQLAKMSLGDALIAGTALVHNLRLVTHNVDDFCPRPRPIHPRSSDVLTQPPCAMSPWRPSEASPQAAPSIGGSGFAPPFACITMSHMKPATLTIRLDPELERQLERVCRETGRTRSDVARDALRRQLSLLRFEQLRRTVLPFAEARGYLTDEDVFRDVS